MRGIRPSPIVGCAHTLSNVESLTVREAAARVGRTEETVRRWIWSGRLAATKRGNTLFIDEDDLPAAGDIGRPSYPRTDPKH